MNIALQHKEMDISGGTKLLKALRDRVNDVRYNLQQFYDTAKRLCEAIYIESEFKEKRKRKMKRMASEHVIDDGSDISRMQNFQVNYLEV